MIEAIIAAIIFLIGWIIIYHFYEYLVSKLVVIKKVRRFNNE